MTTAGGPRAFVRLTRAWLLSIVRDRSTIFWTFAFPILFVVIFGLAFGRSDGSSYRVGIVVDQTTPAGQAVLNAARQVPAFRVSTGTAEEELAKLRQGGRYAVLIQQAAPTAGATPTVPGAQVTMYLDPSRSAAAQIVAPIMRQALDQADRQLSGRAPALTVQEQSVLSSSLRFIDFFLPGIIGFSIMQAGMFAAIPLVQLRVNRVLKRFGATPVPRWSVLASQGVARLLVAFVQMLVLVLVARLLFDVQITGNWLVILAFVLLGGLVFLAMGFTVSGLARTEEAVPALVQVVSFPMMFLSGVFWPIDTFPGFVQTIARALPLTFLGDGLRQAMVGGSPLNPQWLNLLVLAVWLLVSGILATRFFKWE